MRRQVIAGVLCSTLATLVQAEDVQFMRDVVPIFKANCVMCHLPGNGLGGLDLHPRGGYANLVGVFSTQSPLLRVAPGSPEESYLYHKLIGTHISVGGSGERMPFSGTSLSEEQIELIRRWIVNGAQAG